MRVVRQVLYNLVAALGPWQLRRGGYERRQRLREELAKEVGGRGEGG